MTSPFFDLPSTASASNNAEPLLAGAARRAITPTAPLPLVGTLDDTVSDGVLDDLFVRVLVCHQGPWRCGIVQLDLPHLPPSLVTAIRATMTGITGIDAQSMFLVASQTRTAPEMRPDWPGFRMAYQVELLAAVHDACRAAAASVAPVEMVYGETVVDAAFSRRWHMDGRGVVSSPSPGDPALRRPEGPVDPRVTLLGLRDGNGLCVLLVNLANQVATVTGNRFSADWPGALARDLGRRLGERVLVIPLLGANGNLDHLDAASPGTPTAPASQTASTSPIAAAQADRLGALYAAGVSMALGDLRPSLHTHLGYVRRTCRTGSRELTPDQISDALDATHVDCPPPAREPTAADHTLAAPATRRYFADAVLRQAADRQDRHLEVAAMRLGDVLLLALPGVPFSDIGLRIRDDLLRDRPSLVLSSGGTDAGFIALGDHYRRGGWEVTPCMSPISTSTADYLLVTIRDLIRDIEGA